MPLTRAVPVTLTADEPTTLKKCARGAKTAHPDRPRAQSVLAAARGQGNESPRTCVGSVEDRLTVKPRVHRCVHRFVRPRVARRSRHHGAHLPHR
jgi:hypothetical protein